MSRIKKELNELNGIRYEPSNNVEQSTNVHGLRADIDVIGTSYMKSFPVFKSSIEELDERVSENFFCICLNILASALIYCELIRLERKVEENENAKNSLGKNS